MAIGREPDENLVLAMRIKNKRFPLYPMEPLSPQDNSGALVRVAATHSCDNSQRASKLSVAGLLRHIRVTVAEEPPNFLQKSDPQFKELR